MLGGGAVVDLAHLVERAHPMLAALLFAFPKFLVPGDNAALLKALPRAKVPPISISQSQYWTFQSSMLGLG